jgi:hypothetical protein
MQSTGQTSTQLASFVPMHGSVMMYATLLSLRAPLARTLRSLVSTRAAATGGCGG